jgi:tetratricopeptide (TPR) repeat protein
LFSGNFDKAIVDYTKAIEINPKYAKAYDNRGLSRLSKGDFDGAIADHTKAIEVNPSLFDAYANRAQAYHTAGNIKSAILDLRTALKINPSSSFAQTLLKMLCEQVPGECS